MGSDYRNSIINKTNKYLSRQVIDLSPEPKDVARLAELGERSPNKRYYLSSVNDLENIWDYITGSAEGIGQDLEEAQDNLGDSEGLQDQWNERFGEMLDMMQELSGIDFEEFISDLEKSDPPEVETDPEGFKDWLDDTLQEMIGKWDEAIITS